MLNIDMICLPTSGELGYADNADTHATFDAKMNPSMGGADMAKSREKIQQLGFWDAEVSKPNHDAVCLWAYENADLIFRTAYTEIFDRAWLDNEVDFHFMAHQQNNQEMARAFMNANPRPNPRVFKKTLEYVLSSYTGYRESTVRIVGYADLLIQTEIPHVGQKYKSAVVKGRDDVFDGFNLSWSRDQRAPCILVEAKSILPTLGELMRQIQLYRTAFSGKFVVVSPDDAYAKILAEQGVVFVKCDL